MPDIDLGEYKDTYRYLSEREKELSLYLEELKKEYMRVLQGGNRYAIDVMHEKYKSTVRIYKYHVDFMREILAKKSTEQSMNRKPQELIMK